MLFKKESKKEEESEKEGKGAGLKKGVPVPEKLPGFFSMFINSWKSDSAKEDENIFEKFGRVVDNFQDIRKRNEANLGTYQIIAQASLLTREFFVLLIGSTIVATFGLLQDSAAVIIGAMLIAPLMTPILGFALGSIWGDSRLLSQSFLTLVVGSFSVIVIALLITIVVPGVEMNAQIAARVNPNLYDILIALASGFVGSYAFVNPRISSSISGVAIAVALIPPLSVTGISLGQQNYQGAMGSWLLFASNLVGISLAASFVFWRLKVHPYTPDETEVAERAKRKFLLAGIILVIIAIPLGLFMRDSLYIKQQRDLIEREILSGIPSGEIELIAVNKHFDQYDVSCKVIVPLETSLEQYHDLEKKIVGLFEKPAELKLVLIPRMF